MIQTSTMNERVPDYRRADGRSFQTTNWAMILAAREPDDPSGHEALGRLCLMYWDPIYSFIRRQGFDPHQAEDLTQEFFYRLIDRRSLAGIHSSVGKFRSFLLVCLRNFLANERERAQAQRRGSGRPPISLDLREAESRYSQEPVDQLAPDVLFERRWATAIVQQTLQLLRLKYSNAGKDALFEELECFLPGGQGNLSRTQLAAKRGVSIEAIDTAIHRMRRQFGATLRQQVLLTVATEAEVDEEIRHMMSVLSS